MKNLKKILSLLIVFSALYTNAIAQDLPELLKKSYKEILKKENQKINIQISAYQLGDESQLLDSGEIEFIKDDIGYNLKFLDIETIYENGTTVRLDHESKQLDVFVQDTESSIQEELRLPFYFEIFDNKSDKKAQIKKIVEGNLSRFEYWKNQSKEMEFEFLDSQLTKIIRYPIQPVVYRGRTLRTVVVLDYSYDTGFEKRLTVSDILGENKSSNLMRSKYANYQVKDYRKD